MSSRPEKAARPPEGRTMFTSTPSMSMSLTRACESKLTRSSGNGGDSPRHSPARRHALARAKDAVEIRALADAVARHSALARGAPDQGAERGELGLVRRREIPLDGFGGLDDGGGGVEDAISGACHRGPPQGVR